MTDKELVDALARQVITMQMFHVGTSRATMRLAHTSNPTKAGVVLVQCTAQELVSAKAEKRGVRAAIFTGLMTADEYDAWDPDDLSVLLPMNDAARELTKV